MSIVKQIVREQYSTLVNKMAEQIHDRQCPNEGWISMVRKAMGMSAAQLARRLNVTRNHISKTEKGELCGTVTIKTMQNIAQGMGCRFFYAIIPERTIEEIITSQAKKKATQIVGITSKHMALEDQALSGKQIAVEIKRVQKMLLEDMPPDFWNDEIQL